MDVSDVILVVGVAAIIGVSGYLVYKTFVEPSLGNVYMPGSIYVANAQLDLQKGTLEAVIVNKSNSTVVVYVGATLVNGIPGGSGCSLNAAGQPYKDLPVYRVVLNPGESVPLQWTFINQFSGTVSAIIKVWKDYDQSSGSLSGCIFGTYTHG